MYSTASNCPTPVNNAEGNAVDDVETEVISEERCPTQVADKTEGTKQKTQTQAERDNNIEKIIKIAQVEDHPVELALTAVAKQMIRT